MAIGPNEDGAELYREHLESQPCPTCGTRESEYRYLRARIALLEKVVEAAEELRTCMKTYTEHGWDGKLWANYMNAIGAVDTALRSLNEVSNPIPKGE